MNSTELVSHTSSISHIVISLTAGCRSSTRATPPSPPPMINTWQQHLATITRCSQNPWFHETQQRNLPSRTSKLAENLGLNLFWIGMAVDREKTDHFLVGKFIARCALYYTVQHEDIPVRFAAKHRRNILLAPDIDLFEIVFLSFFQFETGQRQNFLTPSVQTWVLMLSTHVFSTITSWNFDFSWYKTSSTASDIAWPGHSSLISLNHPSFVEFIPVCKKRELHWNSCIIAHLPTTPLNQCAQLQACQPHQGVNSRRLSHEINWNRSNTLVETKERARTALNENTCCANNPATVGGGRTRWDDPHRWLRQATSVVFVLQKWTRRKVQMLWHVSKQVLLSLSLQNRFWEQLCVVCPQINRTKQAGNCAVKSKLSPVLVFLDMEVAMDVEE